MDGLELLHSKALEKGFKFNFSKQTSFDDDNDSLIDYDGMENEYEAKFNVVIKELKETQDKLKSASSRNLK